ncbi:GNAT family N-acetyltransferase [Streptomyces sp. NPDC006879]|uniref:GNAT family N-acetyltransferase n=1 Tax=Streptomyces sp. NPDC006879 TaxID=3364767 RepID=UPI003698E2C6
MGMSVTISAANSQDAEQIFRLQYLCFQREAELYGNYHIDPLVQTLDSIRAELSRDCVLVARLGDEVVGMVRGHTDEGGVGRIAKLGVHPRMQGHGLGTRLLRAMEGELVARGETARFQLHSGHRSEGGLRLYKRAGYAAVGDSTGEDGVRMIVLEKEAAGRDTDYVVSA